MRPAPSRLSFDPNASASAAQVHAAHLRARREASLWWGLVGAAEDAAGAVCGAVMAVPNRVFGRRRAPVAVGLLAVALIAAPLLRPDGGGGGDGDGGGGAGLLSSVVGSAGGIAAADASDEVVASASATAGKAAAEPAPGGGSRAGATANDDDDDDDDDGEASAGLVPWLVDRMQRTLVDAVSGSGGGSADDDDDDDDGGRAWLAPLVSGVRTAFGFVGLSDAEED